MTFVLLVVALSYLNTSLPPVPSSLHGEIKGRLCRVSWYKHGKVMANGQKFNPNSRVTIAHKTLPFGTRVLMVNPKNGRWLICKVCDRGPFVRGVEYDLAQGVAKHLGVTKDKDKRPRLKVWVLSQPRDG